MLCLHMPGGGGEGGGGGGGGGERARRDESHVHPLPGWSIPISRASNMCEKGIFLATRPLFGSGVLLHMRFCAVSKPHFYLQARIFPAHAGRWEKPRSVSSPLAFDALRRDVCITHSQLVCNLLDERRFVARPTLSSPPWRVVAIMLSILYPPVWALSGVGHGVILNAIVCFVMPGRASDPPATSFTDREPSLGLLFTLAHRSFSSLRRRSALPTCCDSPWSTARE